jgi:N-methylhydantoinase B/oxoprolinase/acetone carboxylase alpha subunit
LRRWADRWLVRRLFKLRKGDVFRIETPGAGGWGAVEKSDGGDVI